MKDGEADIAIGVLNKLIDQELEAVRAATRDGIEHISLGEQRIDTATRDVR